ncbi:hypothetical protein [Kosakonia cowanii]|uniref:hypothetical protein n=1 Tax=Kosakonia cowanii TaxID=208223 RepID=UPI0035E3E1AA
MQLVSRSQHIPGNEFCKILHPDGYGGYAAWGNRMTLSDLIDQLDSFGEEKTIYAKQPWHPDTVATVADEPDDGGKPNEASKIGAEYFLEIFLANDFLGGWISHLDKEPTVEEKCLRLIKYAEDNA